MNLRPMQMSDADFMLELKNDPQTREFALLTQDEIKREDHMKWLPKHIDEFQIIEEAGRRRIGAVRVQDIPNDVPEGSILIQPSAKSEVSIWIDRKYWGCGWATDTIKKVRKHRMSAKIVKENIPSMRAFIKAGFLPVTIADDKFYIFTYKATDLYATT